jgi:very-short-patch-repair endonuclease
MWRLSTDVAVSLRPRPREDHDRRMQNRTRGDAIANVVRGGGGVVRQSTLSAQGFSKYAVAEAVADGQILRVRRSWLAVPDADPYLFAAARAGVVLTCVTHARRLGLWVLESDQPHVGAPGHSGGVRIETREDLDTGESVPKAVVHWSRPLIARAPGTLVDPIENVLELIAQCQPFEAALAVWESALRQQRIDPLAIARLPLSASARAVLERASPFSDSGLETLVVPRLGWMKLRMVPQAWVCGHRVDFLIGDRLVLQIDGAHHVGFQREQDIRHDAQLMLRGFHVIRVGYRQIVEDWPSVQDLILRAVAQGLHRAA